MATDTFVGVPQLDSARKPLSNLVDSARVARTWRDATPFVTAGLSSAPMAKNAVGDLATDPGRSHPGRMSAAHLIGCKDGDRADSQVDESEESH